MLFSPEDKSVSAKISDISSSGSSYRAAGVDIDLAHDLLSRVKDRIGRAARPEMLTPIGGFGGLFRLDIGKYTDPVMVVSIDGVGTKLMIASMMDSYEGIGYDIVNHCINDVAVQGAEPLYFLDYLGIGRLRSPLYEQILGSVADACAAQRVALLGGETAEMPGMYGDDFDLVGCITGIVERDRMITGESIVAGDLILGLAANGLHTNGYSLAREVLLKKAGLDLHSVPPGMDESIGTSLLKPHPCYWPAISLMLKRNLPLRGMAHITGGGWKDNIKRILPSGVMAQCQTGILPVPPIMDLIARLGGVETREMYRTFNMGLGMVWVIPPEAEKSALDCCKQAGIMAASCGRIVAGSEQAVELCFDG